MIPLFVRCIACPYQKNPYEPAFMGCGTEECYYDNLGGNNNMEDKIIIDEEGKYCIPEEVYNLKKVAMNWVKEHKKDLFIAASSALLTSYIYNKYGIVLRRNRNFLNLSFGGDLNQSGEIKEIISDGYIKKSLRNFTVKDLGKLGKEMIKSYPGIINDKTKVDWATISYSIYKRGFKSEQ